MASRSSATDIRASGRRTPAARIAGVLRARGLRGLVVLAWQRAFPPRLACLAHITPAFDDANGLEIGGPSAVFGRRGPLPAYALARRIDNCNFGPATMWEGSIEEGPTFRFDRDRSAGIQHVAEATRLDFAADARYDFVLSSHALEHVANPLAALAEWKRVLKPGGTLALVLPDRAGTFDHRRPVTTLEHLVTDFENGTDESDQTHVDEILALHDYSMDPEAGGPEAFRARALRNAENRGLHHHVFDAALAGAMVEHAGFEVIATETLEPFHIFVIGRALT